MQAVQSFSYLLQGPILSLHGLKPAASAKDGGRRLNRETALACFGKRSWDSSGDGGTYKAVMFPEFSLTAQTFTFPGSSLISLPAHFVRGWIDSRLTSL